ncbi:hypothetical protein AB395_00005159 (plasmid) [Sinorhizobium fredii CCBAU 45436]|nr:hypothetical protein AB395_00005159 [Sinorhizobium fredii CCBAU 45436]
MFRTVALWITGVIAPFAIGTGVGHAIGSEEAGFFLGIGFAFAFICARLWIIENRSERHKV